MNHDKSIMWRKTVQWERLESVSHGWPTLETSHNTAFVQAVTEALFGGAAADTSWPACWNNAWRTILKPAAYACTKSVKGYEMLATSSLDKSTLSLEVERSFNRALTSLFPFFNVCLEQATRGFYGNGWRSFWVRSRQRYWAIIVHSNFQRVFSIEVPCLSLESPSLHCKRKEKFNFKRYQSWQSEFAAETRRCSGVLENRYWCVVIPFLFFDQSKK